MTKGGAKTFMIEEYFKDIEGRIAFLDELVSSGHGDEAFLLCSVYIESLANRYYQDYGSAKGFCLALTNLTENELFSFVHPRELLDKLESKKLFNENISEIKSVLEPLANELHTLEAINELLSEILTEQQSEWLEENWLKGSIAMIVYERIRCDAVHDIYATKLSFSTSKVNGISVPDIDYDLLKSALDKVVSYLKETSLSENTLFLQHHA